MQAAIIASTVYEEVQYALHFYFNNEALTKYIEIGHKDFNKQLKDFLQTKQIDKITQENLNQIGATRSGKSLYKIYEILCRFKHPHPKRIRLLQDIKTREIKSFMGNKYDNRSVSFSFFILYNSADLSSMLSLQAIDNLKILGKHTNELLEKYNETKILSSDVDEFVKNNHPDWCEDPFLAIT